MIFFCQKKEQMAIGSSAQHQQCSTKRCDVSSGAFLFSIQQYPNSIESEFGSLTKRKVGLSRKKDALLALYFFAPFLWKPLLDNSHPCHAWHHSDLARCTHNRGKNNNNDNKPRRINISYFILTWIWYSLVYTTMMIVMDRYYDGP
jgi:hypothetical protein